MTTLMPDTIAPPSESGQWPARRSQILDWLVNGTRDERFIDNIFVQLCDRLRAGGMPLARATLAFTIQNPQWLGARILWRKDQPNPAINMFDHDVLETAQYLNSPVSEIDNGADEVRERLDVDDGRASRHAIFDDLRSEGLTDYVAWPILHTLGKRHVISFGCDRPGGFSEEDISFLRDLLPALALVSEIRIKNRLARTLLETYVGPHASELILAGATRRGSGVTVGAAILICDLRDFTTISELWPRDHVIDLLNGYFDAMSEPIERNGGEILKFVGDGLLAVFPLSNPDACAALLRSVGEARAAMSAVNAEHVRLGHDPLGYGVGIHVGDVMYGNIGSRKRLDFTVIGPAVNVASRLETLTKEVKRPVLLSRAFADMAGDHGIFDNLGFYPLKGLGEPLEVLALRLP
ncbi:adenylate cyclase [Aureimonas sp. SA4125]|uniref:adenylate/guanylate cyclase domain-containing protein n=1 Tax=Aureimonas sp. SA4125 TaxID=2826993 RepID=UPI001CC33EFF|nr:adenylate/guanylate cyclase domain-containing protein [Aureimonas sp. SA4125]BDA84581.1 adenylate cyclase [Aureimonas sp. SA4125]